MTDTNNIPIERRTLGRRYMRTALIFLAAVIGALYINAALTLADDDARYQLVRFYMGEVDILDHDLTVEDCAIQRTAALAQSIPGEDYACEAQERLASWGWR